MLPMKITNRIDDKGHPWWLWGDSGLCDPGSCIAVGIAPLVGSPRQISCSLRGKTWSNLPVLSPLTRSLVSVWVSTHSSAMESQAQNIIWNHVPLCPLATGANRGDAWPWRHMWSNIVRAHSPTFDLISWPKIVFDLRCRTWPTQFCSWQLNHYSEPFPFDVVTGVWKKRSAWDVMTEQTQFTLKEATSSRIVYWV